MVRRHLFRVGELAFNNSTPHTLFFFKLPNRRSYLANRFPVGNLVLDPYVLHRSVNRTHHDLRYSDTSGSTKLYEGDLPSVSIPLRKVGVVHTPRHECICARPWIIITRQFHYFISMVKPGPPPEEASHISERKSPLWLNGVITSE